MYDLDLQERRCIGLECTIMVHLRCLLVEPTSVDSDTQSTDVGLKFETSFGLQATDECIEERTLSIVIVPESALRGHICD